MGWHTMEEWRTSGPTNGETMLLLLHDGGRVLGFFNGYSQCWKTDLIETIVTPVAWAPIPGVPPELLRRIERVEEERQKLNALEKSPL